MPHNYISLSLLSTFSPLIQSLRHSDVKPLLSLNTETKRLQKYHTDSSLLCRITCRSYKVYSMNWTVSVISCFWISRSIASKNIRSIWARFGVLQNSALIFTLSGVSMWISHFPVISHHQKLKCFVKLLDFKIMKYSSSIRHQTRCQSNPTISHKYRCCEKNMSWRSYPDAKAISLVDGKFESWFISYFNAALYPFTPGGFLY